MRTSPVKTRFAPSPTGGMHLGNLRTALLNWLLATRTGGVFCVRIEDTDRLRSDAAHARAILEDLAWLGLEPGEPVIRQSERTDVYADLYARLEAEDRAYPCFCTQEELALARAAQRASGRPPRYSGTCAGLDAGAREQRLAQGRVPTLRFRVPAGQTVDFVDAVKGQQRFATDDLGDFIIRRADGSAAFLFCNAVDDALTGIDMVLRGEDHLTNTPRQRLLLEALGLPVPTYGHASTILGDDGAPLSKRNGSRTVAELRLEGLLPLAVLNYLARLGHGIDDEALLPAAELAQAFSLERLGRAPGHFDLAQLRHWQRLAVLQLESTALDDWVVEALRSGTDLVPESLDPGRLQAFARLVQSNVLDFADIAGWARVVFVEPDPLTAEAQALEQAAGAGFFEAAAQALGDREEATLVAAWPELLTVVKQQTGARGKGLFMPLRLALSGRDHGPELPRLAAVLGVAECRRRLLASAARVS